MRIAGYIAAFLGGLIVAYLMVSVGVFDVWDGIPGTQQEPMLSLPTYLSFLSVMLTAVTAVLAAVAIFIGIVAALTFRDLSDKAELAAQRRADEALSDDVIIKRIDEISFRHRGPKSVDELEEDFDPDDSGER